MTDSCWQPQVPDSPGWASADSCGATNQWTPGANSDSRACIAVACIVVACSPEPPPDWLDDGVGNALVCGDGGETWPPSVPDEPDVPPVVIERAFSDGFSGGFE